jgi:hypothetical protein
MYPLHFGYSVAIFVSARQQRHPASGARWDLGVSEFLGRGVHAGVRAASTRTTAWITEHGHLYRPFAGRDEILVHVVGHVLGEVADTSTWQERLIADADALFWTLKEHPKVVSLFDDRRRRRTGQTSDRPACR